MKIGVSACLIGENCKYNGKNNYSEKVMAFLKDKDIVSICPEVLGGLAIPREKAEIVNGCVMTETGVSVDEAYRRGAEKALEILMENHVECVVLQSRSPSCGVNQVYDGNFTKNLIKGSGIAAALFQKNGIQTIDLEDL